MVQKKTAAKKTKTKTAQKKPAAKTGAKNKEALQPVTKDMTIGEVIQKYPDSAKVMMQHGLHCIGCHVSVWETIEQGAAMHGIDVGKLVADINKQISSKK